MAGYTGVLIYTNQYSSVTQNTIFVPGPTDTSSINSGHRILLTVLNVQNGEPATVNIKPDPTIFNVHGFSTKAFGGDLYFHVLTATSTSSSSLSSSSSSTQSIVNPDSTSQGTGTPLGTSPLTSTTTSYVWEQSGLMMSSGALAGIVVTVAVTVALLTSVLTALLIRHRQRKKKQRSALGPVSSEPNMDVSSTANEHDGGSTMVESDPRR